MSGGRGKESVQWREQKIRQQKKKTMGEEKLGQGNSKRNSMIKDYKRRDDSG